MPGRTAVIILGSLALATAALAGPGHAQPGFISDVTTLTAHESAGQYAVALAPGGTAHAVWVEETGTNFLLMASSRPRGGTWSAPVQVDTGSTTQDAEPSIAVDGQGGVVAAWRDYLPGRTGSVIRTATLSVGGWSASQDLSPTTTHAFEPEVAVDARGDAAIVWSEDIDLSGRRAVGAHRAAGGTWTTSYITTGPGAGAATVAVQPDGRAVALWTQGGSVQTADKTLAGGTWSPARQLSATNGQWLNAVVDIDGDVIAAWSSASLTGLSTIETASRSAAGDWSPTTVLASSTSSLAWQLDLGVGDSGEALAAWVVSSDGNRRSDLWTAARTSAGTWTTRKVASPQVYNSAPTVGFGTGGASVVLWTGSTEQLTSARTLYAVTRTPGEEWVPPTALASGSISGPEAAVDPAGHGTLLWAETGGALRAQAFDGVAPTVEAFHPTIFARTGLAAAYTARASDLWSAPTVTWQFGERPPVTGSSVTRTFSRSGLQRVRLRVIDAAQNTTVRRSVTIVADRRPTLRSVSLDRSVIRDSGPNRVSRARLSYRLGAPALVRVQVLNRSGTVVRTVERALDAGTSTVSLTARRLELHQGRYTVRVLARNALGRAVSAKLPLRVRS
jgi:hypothetical protein